MKPSFHPVGSDFRSRGFNGKTVGRQVVAGYDTDCL